MPWTAAQPWGDHPLSSSENSDASGTFRAADWIRPADRDNVFTKLAADSQPSFAASSPIDRSSSACPSVAACLTDNSSPARYDSATPTPSSSPARSGSGFPNEALPAT